MPQIVKADVGKPGPFQERLEAVGVEVTAPQRAAGGVAKNPGGIAKALGRQGGLVFTKGLDHHRWQWIERRLLAVLGSPRMSFPLTSARLLQTRTTFRSRSTWGHWSPNISPTVHPGAHGQDVEGMEAIRF